MRDPIPQTNFKKGWARVGGKKNYYRTGLEVQWARVLQLCKLFPAMSDALLDCEIKDWEYEPYRFRFYGDAIPKHLQGKQLGVRVYVPDFKIIRKDGTHFWHETKGFFAKKDYTKLRCFSKYYPDEKLIMVLKRLPKGKTRNSLQRRSRIMKVKELGYELFICGEVIKRSKGMFKLTN